MPSVELVDGKWVKVDGVRAEDLDGTAAKKPAPAPAPAAAPKPAKVKTDYAKAVESIKFAFCKV